MMQTPGPGLIQDGAQRLEVALDNDAAERLWALVERLLKWNKRINVVGPCDARQAIDRHIHDSLGLLRLLDDPEVSDHTQAWTDIGAGGGFPGLVLAIARPTLRLRLVEPITKKIAFAQSAIGALRIEGIEIENSRMEALEHGVVRGAMSRATFAPQTWVERAQSFVAPQGLILATMGGDAQADILKRAWKIDRFSLPISGAGRTTAILRT